MLVDTIWQSNWFLVLRSLYFESILSLYLTDNLLYLISDTTFIIMYNWGCVMADNYSQIFLLYFNVEGIISDNTVFVPDNNRSVLNAGDIVINCSGYGREEIIVQNLLTSLTEGFNGQNVGNIRCQQGDVADDII
jgi:hypothetical protein